MPIQVIDLFAGAGLFGSGFVKAGFEVVQSVELDKVAAQTYSRNLDSEVVVGDVRLANPVSTCNVIIAGPPCQGFSTLGKRNPNDERNFLSLEILRWAKLACPEIVVVENVANFLGHPVWQQLAAGFFSLGYKVHTEVLNATDYGVPQVRKRSFTIASKIGKPIIEPLKQVSPVTIWEAWEGLPLIPDGQNHHYAPIPSKLAYERMTYIPTGGDKRDIMKSAPHLAPPSWWRLGAQVTDAWGRMDWNKPSNTIRTALQNPSKGRYIHPEQNRVISLREAARLQSIEDSWVFEGAPTQIARQIGNSVPPLVSEAVARSIYQLFGNSRYTRNSSLCADSVSSSTFK